MADVDAVLFDLDGTLCVHAGNEAALLDDAFERVGCERAIDTDHLHAVDTASLPAVETRRDFFEALFVAAADRADASVETERIRAAARAFDDRRDPTNVAFRPGARDALAAARERGPVGLVTNGSEAVQAGKLETLGIGDVFDATVFCDPEAGVAPKPDTYPISTALDALGVPPADALLVGDSLEVDVAGAHAAGARSAWVPHFENVEDSRDVEPTYVLDSMGEVATLLEH